MSEKDLRVFYHAILEVHNKNEQMKKMLIFTLKRLLKNRTITVGLLAYYLRITRNSVHTGLKIGFSEKYYILLIELIGNLENVRNEYNTYKFINKGLK